jgi:transcriptional regulator with XRE-family HTH domain
MSSRRDEAHMFRVLLRHHRQRRGMSQLDLSLAAEVSSRHVSFLETGRATPSRDMILRLAAALGLELREVNALLQAAAFPPVFTDSAPEQPWAPAIERVIARMLEQQEPYPMIVMNARCDVLRLNRAAALLLPRFVQDPTALGDKLNAMHGLFNPLLMRPYVEDWAQVAQFTLMYLQREALGRPVDSSIAQLVRELFSYPDVPRLWRELDFEMPPMAALEVGLLRDGERLRFLSTVTHFPAALDAGLAELRFESYFPADEATEARCRALVAPTHDTADGSD